MASYQKLFVLEYCSDVILFIFLNKSYSISNVTLTFMMEYKRRNLKYFRFLLFGGYMVNS